MSVLARREAHAFEAAGQRFLYLVPSAAVFAVDECSQAVLDLLDTTTLQEDALIGDLSSRFAPA